MKRFCLVNGNHTNPEYARECPVLQARRRAERRQERSEAGGYLPTGSPPWSVHQPAPVRSIQTG